MPAIAGPRGTRRDDGQRNGVLKLLRTVIGLGVLRPRYDALNGGDNVRFLSFGRVDVDNGRAHIPREGGKFVRSDMDMCISDAVIISTDVLLGEVVAADVDVVDRNMVCREVVAVDVEPIGVFCRMMGHLAAMKGVWRSVNHVRAPCSLQHYLKIS